MNKILSRIIVSIPKFLSSSRWLKHVSNMFTIMQVYKLNIIVIGKLIVFNGIGLSIILGVQNLLSNQKFS